MVPVNVAAEELMRNADKLSGRAFRESKMSLAGTLQEFSARIGDELRKFDQDAVIKDARQPEFPAVAASNDPSDNPRTSVEPPGEGKKRR